MAKIQAKNRVNHNMLWLQHLTTTSFYFFKKKVENVETPCYNLFTNSFII